MVSSEFNTTPIFELYKDAIKSSLDAGVKVFYEMVIPALEKRKYRQMYEPSLKPLPLDLDEEGEAALVNLSPKDLTCF